MNVLRKILYTGFVFHTLNAYLLGAQFNFPAETPGLQAIDVQAPTNNLINCKHIIVPGTDCHLYFPTDGSQPDATDAELWSGANYNDPANENNLITNWWVRIFGGNNAVNLSRIGAPDISAEPQMGFCTTGVAHIIQIEAGAPQGFEQQFWQTFRTIAADPVGRVLLYRLLIEIRRTDDSNANECYDDGNATVVGGNAQIMGLLSALEITVSILIKQTQQ